MDKKIAFEKIDQNQKMIAELSDAIWDFAELSLQEYKSCAYYVEKCKEAGFEVEEQFCGIPTAFKASFGSGRPVIGILAEYDALSGLSQTAGALEQEEIVSGGNGHGCGHNMLGAGAFAAALGVKAWLEERAAEAGKSVKASEAGKAECENVGEKGCGTVILFGCPGEEGWASKAYMAREHVWDDLDAALTWHPGDTNEVTTGSSNSCLQYLYKFNGVASHASGNPEAGRSALDAVELMNIGVQFLREHMSSKARIHYSIIDNGGMSPNVVQSKASVLYYVRENHIGECAELLKRVDKIAEGAALMTETTMEKFFIDGLADTVTNRALEEVLYKNLVEVGVPEYTEEEIEYTNKLAATYGGYSEDGSHKLFVPGLGSEVDEDYAAEVEEMVKNNGHALNTFILPHFKGSVFRPGSTDVGDVSWNCPTAQITTASWPNGQAGHSWQNVACGATSVGHKSVIYAGKVIAGAAIDLYENPEILVKAKEEFVRRTKSGYVCPFPPEAKPEIVEF